jgi:hypothetical protein
VETYKSGGTDAVSSAARDYLRATAYYLLARQYEAQGSVYEALRYYKRYLEYAGDSAFLSARTRVWMLTARILINNRSRQI